MNLQHHPHLDLVPIGGLNDFSEPRYRIIWAPSRLFWTGVKTMPMYSAPPGRRALNPIQECGGNVWVLEQWQSAANATALTPEQWARDPMYMGRDYPHRGEYYLCPQGIWRWTPVFSEVRLVVSMLEAGRHRRPIENRLAIRDEVEREEKAKDNTLYDKIYDSLIPWPAQSVAGANFRKEGKSQRPMLTAEQAGLHTQGMRMRRSRRKVEIPVGVAGADARRSRIVVP